MEITIKSLMGPLGEPNHNGRIYNPEVIQKAIESWKEQGEISHMGEMNRDYGWANADNDIHTSLQNVTHRVEDLWIENGEVCGKIKMLDTPKGRIAQSVIEYCGKTPKLSPRMLANKIPVLDEDGSPKLDANGNQIYEIQDVQIVGVDIMV